MSSPTQCSFYPFASGIGLRMNITPSHQDVHAADSGEIMSGMPWFRNPSVTLKARTGLSMSSTVPASDSRQTASPKANAQTAGQTVLCSCHRPPSLVLCTSCGHNYSGRVRRRCPVHPSQIYLMDNESCPQCSSSCLREYSKTKK